MGWRCMCVVFTILSTSLGNAKSEDFIDEVEPNSDYEGQCYDEDLGRGFDEDVTWVKKGQCMEFRCTVHNGKFLVVGSGCGVREPLSPSCLTQGHPELMYPDCCPVEICARSMLQIVRRRGQQRRNPKTTPGKGKDRRRMHFSNLK
uniref:Single domain-containing protein n=1 Tax=Timema bartmani TaxID=61472 RepID=A0A7R9I584_9NEOP|nr:unnamed protein product [Timema bartmani]